MFTLFLVELEGYIVFLIASSSFQARGKVNKGRRFSEAKLWGGIHRSLALRSRQAGF
jgi:hypothetical protein